LEESTGRQSEALLRLKAVVARFDQGFGTADLLEASQILEGSAGNVRRLS
jgi:hypothetical protein